LTGSIWEIIKEKRNCKGCPLKDAPQLLLNVDKKVNVMVITEGPNVEAPKEFITSIANYPTFMYLQTLFKGNFHPYGKDATVYWTHVRKCFIKNCKGRRFVDKKGEKKALKVCSDAYLEDEIKTVKPKLIVAVGRKATDFLSRYNQKLKSKLKTLMTSENLTVIIDGMVSEVVVVPHPSGRSRTLTNLEKDENWKEIRDALERISEKIVKAVSNY